MKEDDSFDGDYIVDKVFSKVQKQINLPKVQELDNLQEGIILPNPLDGEEPEELDGPRYDITLLSPLGDVYVKLVRSLPESQQGMELAADYINDKLDKLDISETVKNAEKFTNAELAFRQSKCDQYCTLFEVWSKIFAYAAKPDSDAPELAFSFTRRNIKGILAGMGGVTFRCAQLDLSPGNSYELTHIYGSLTSRLDRAATNGQERRSVQLLGYSHAFQAVFRNRVREYMTRTGQKG